MRHLLRHAAWTLLLLTVLGRSRLSDAQEQATPRAPETDSVAAVIDKLPEVAEQDVGYMATMSGSGFLPLGTSEAGAFLLGQQPARSSGTLRQLVAKGTAAIPDLVAHLDDQRETRIQLEFDAGFGGMFFVDEYDYNRRTAKSAPAGVNRDFFAEDGDHPHEYTVTVGDLCFVALGQIVNRSFNAVRYQPTACIMVNSPTYSERLRKAITDEWGSLTKDQHRQSLIRDFKEPDHEDRRTGAAIRLGYFYPEELEPLVLTQLAEPLFDVFEVEKLAREKLYAAKDAQERKALLDAFLAKAGEQSRQGVVDQLFADLNLEEADEEGRLSPPLKPRRRARECLVELFGYSPDVKGIARPFNVLNSEAIQARLVDTIALFPSPNTDTAVRKILHSTDDDYLARACARYLVGRGADEEIRAYVAKRLPTTDEAQKRDLERISAQIGWTPLHVAAEKYENEWLEELLSKGADVNARAEDGKTPLHVAAESGSYGGLRVLIAHKADLNIRDKQGKTPIQLGLAYDSAVDFLLDAGAEIPDILVAAFAGRDDLVAKFLEEDKGLALIRSKGGDTPLHYAAQRGHVRAAELLVAAGADVNARDNDRNRLTPLHWAAIYGHSKVVALLLEHKADRNARDWDGKTPLSHAISNLDAATIRLLLWQ